MISAYAKLRRLALLATAATLLAGVSLAHADFPERPITVIVPSGAGGGTDTHARALASQLEGILKTPITVVNRPGGGGFIGAQALLDARDDGHTIMIQSFGTFMLNGLRKQQPIDPIKDFKTVGMIGELVTGIAVRAEDERFKTIEDFVAYARANPGMSYGVAGNGSWHHAAAIGLQSGSGFDSRVVVFKGGGEVRAALLGGQVDYVWMGVQQVAGFEEKIRMLAVNSEERYPLADSIPTLSEKGVTATPVSSPMIIAVSTKVDDTIVEILSDAVEKAATSAEFKAALTNAKAVPKFKSGKAARAYILSLGEAWLPVARSMK
ncbi:MAG: tripartite tricarboxylate transporter substrate binding protein [Rhodospirillales bacterium]